MCRVAPRSSCPWSARLPSSCPVPAALAILKPALLDLPCAAPALASLPTSTRTLRPAKADSPTWLCTRRGGGASRHRHRADRRPIVCVCKKSLKKPKPKHHPPHTLPRPSPHSPNLVRVLASGARALPPLSMALAESAGSPADAPAPKPRRPAGPSATNACTSGISPCCLSGRHGCPIASREGSKEQGTSVISCKVLCPDARRASSSRMRASVVPREKFGSGQLC